MVTASLSLVFCEPPEGAICLTCGTHLELGNYGALPAVALKKKKRRKKITEGGNDDSRVGTPAAG